MVAAPEYSLKKQAKLVNAICALHNFIRVYNPEDGDDNLTDGHVERAAPQYVRENFATDVSAAEREEASEKRDGIAKAMWEEYLAYNESIM